MLGAGVAKFGVRETTNVWTTGGRTARRKTARERGVALRRLLALTVRAVRLHKVSDEADNRENHQCAVTACKKDMRPEKKAVGSKAAAAAAVTEGILTFYTIEGEKIDQKRCLSFCAAHSVRPVQKQCIPEEEEEKKKMATVNPLQKKGKNINDIIK